MGQKRKVLFLIESLAGGGAEKILLTIASHINKDKFDITVATVVADGVYADRISEFAHFKPLIKAQNKLIYKILYHLIYFHLPLWIVYKLFIPKGNDVEVAFCEGFATKLLAHSPNKKKIAWVHTDMLLNPWTQGAVYPSIEKEKKVYLKYSKVMCVSETVKESVSAKFGIKANTIYNPINSGEIISKSKEKVFLPPKRKLRLVTTGRLVEQKGYDRLVRIINKLRNKKYSCELWILGEGPERKKLVDYIEKNKLNDDVKMWGFVSNPYPYIAACDLFVCSSRCEGYSTAATEAIILGLPVVTTLCSGMRELLGDNEYGIIVENEDMSLLEPLTKIISNRNYLSELTSKAKERSNDFRISSLMKPIETLLT